MNNLDLYKSLILNISKKDLTAVQKKELIDKISICDKEGHNLIYSLIKTHFNQNNLNPENNLVIPYDGNKKNDGFEFNLLNLPNELRQILLKFVILHTRKIEVDNELKNNINKSKHE